MDAVVEDLMLNIEEECTIPQFKDKIKFVFPEHLLPSLEAVTPDYVRMDVFRTIPGVTQAVFHYISITGTTICVPLGSIPAHYRKEGEQQVQDMLDKGIAEESSSPWMTPAGFVKKKSG